MLKNTLLSICVALNTLCLFGQPVYAATTQTIVCDNLPADAKAQCLSGGESKVGRYVDRTIQGLLYIVGIASVIMLIIGGARYITAGNSQDAVAGAKRTITYALIGLVTSILAYALVRFLLRRIF